MDEHHNRPVGLATRRLLLHCRATRGILDVLARRLGTAPTVSHEKAHRGNTRSFMSEGALSYAIQIWVRQEPAQELRAIRPVSLDRSV